MNKNTVTGFVLIALVLIGFSWWTAPSQEELEAQRKEQEKQELAEAKAKQEKKDAEAAQDGNDRSCRPGRHHCPLLPLA